MVTPTSSAFITAVIAALASAVESITGSPVSITPGGPAVAHGWIVPVTLSGSLRSHVRLLLDDAGVTALANVILGSDADTGEGAARGLLGELTSQAISAACLEAPFTKIVATTGPVAAAPAQGDESPVCTLALGTLTLAIAAATIDAAPAVAADVTMLAAPSVVPGVAQARKPAAVSTPANLEVVLDIELPLSVRFGSTMMSIRSLSQIGPGSIVDMGRSPDDPVEILVCGRPIARAEVVVVGGNYGVRITDLTSAAERLRAMEGQL